MADKLHFMGEGNRGPRGGLLYVFHCPGCKCGHPFEVNAPNGVGWEWNNSLTLPTFSQSLLCNMDSPKYRCHSIVEDGKIQFLSDCFHELRGQTVEIPDWDSEEDDGWIPS